MDVMDGRRALLKGMVALPLLPVLDAARSRESKALIKLSCNLYSFNDRLRSGEMSLEEVFQACSDMGFEAVDPTGYYFPGYPEVPDTAYVYHIKKRAFTLGLDISGTGVRNDFVTADRDRREADVALVKNWVEVAAKLGAPGLRIFAGGQVDRLPEGHTRAEVTDRLVEAIKECVEYGRARGVMIHLQNHHDFLATADQVLQVRERVDSEWFGLNVDIGSLRTRDPYDEIRRLAPYANTWQIKEHVYRGETAEKTDVNKLVSILHEVGYRGYIPLETLPPADPMVDLPRFLADVKEALGRS